MMTKAAADSGSGSRPIFSNLGIKIMSGLLGILGMLIGGIYFDLKGDLMILTEDGKKDRQTMTELKLDMANDMANLDKKIERGFIIDSLVIDQMKEVKASIEDLEDRIP